MGSCCFIFREIQNSYQNALQRNMQQTQYTAETIDFEDRK